MSGLSPEQKMLQFTPMAGLRSYIKRPSKFGLIEPFQNPLGMGAKVLGSGYISFFENN
jgi:hypothetical protein